MVDWYLFLTPLLLSPIVALFVFVGCALEHPAGSPPNVLLKLDADPAFSVSMVKFDIQLSTSDSSPSTPTSVSLHPATPDEPTISSPDHLGGTYREVTILLTRNPRLFQYFIISPNTGQWTVSCSVFLEGALVSLPTVSHTARTVTWHETTVTERFLFKLQRNPATSYNPEVILQFDI